MRSTKAKSPCFIDISISCHSDHEAKVRVNKDETVTKIVHVFYAQNHLDPQLHRIRYNGARVYDGETFRALKMKDGDRIDISHDQVMPMMSCPCLYLHFAPPKPPKKE